MNHQQDMCNKQMIERQEKSRNLGDWNLVVTKTSQKLSIRAYEADSEDYLFAEFRTGSFPSDLLDFYGDQEMIFRVLICQQGVRVKDQKLYIPYTKIIMGRPVKKQFMYSFGKVQGNEVAKLRNEVQRLSAEVDRLAQLQEKVKLQDKFIQLISDRCEIYLYSPGQIIPLQFPQIPETSLYRLRGRYLDKKPAKKQNSNHLCYPKYTDVSGYPIDSKLNLFTYQVTVNSGKGFVFIGLQQRYQQKNGMGMEEQRISNITDQKQLVKEFSQNRLKYMIKKQNTCDYWANISLNSDNIRLAIANKGDIYSLTVDQQKKSLTWFKNRVSIERSYYTSTDPILYPFIFLSDDMEVII